MFEIACGVCRLKRSITGTLERFDVSLYRLRLAHLLDRVVRLHKDQARLVITKAENVDHRHDAGRRSVFEPLDMQTHVTVLAQLDQVLDLLPAVLPHAPPVKQGRLGGNRAEHGREAVSAIKDLLPPLPGLQRPAPKRGWPRSSSQQRLGIGANMQNARQHQRHEDADGGGVVLVTREFAVEDLGKLTPPGPGPGPDIEDLDKVRDERHQGPYPDPRFRPFLRLRYRISG